MRVAITGAAGTIGRALTEELLAHDIEVVGIDTTPHQEHVRRADMTLAWAAREAIFGCDAVVHLSGLGTPDSSWSDQFLAAQHTLNSNMISGANVFAAASELGVNRVVWASSETVLGAPYTTDSLPMSLPLIEDSTTNAHTAYAMSKATLETLAKQFSGTARTVFVALRFSLVMRPDDYTRLLPKIAKRPERGAWNLWSYVDLADAVQACRLALSVPLRQQANVFNIAAADTLSIEPTADLVGLYLPQLRAHLGPDVTGRSALFASKAAGEILGWQPVRHWTTL